MTWRSHTSKRCLAVWGKSVHRQMSVDNCTQAKVRRQLYASKRPSTNVHTHTRKFLSTQANVRQQMYTHTHANFLSTNVHTHTQISVDNCTHTSKFLSTNVHTQANFCRQMYTHTHANVRC